MEFYIITGIVTFVCTGLIVHIIRQQRRLVMAESFLQHMNSMEEENQRLQEKILELSTYNAELISNLTHERKNAAEKIDLLTKAEEKLRDTFKALSSDVLQSNNQSFLNLAKTALEKLHESSKLDLDARHQAIHSMLLPVKETLGQVDHKIQELEKSRVGAYEGLKQQIQDLLLTQKELRHETSNLVQALRAPITRGRWGEIQLRRVVEMAGMLSHCDFMEQSSYGSDEGRLRPDMVIRLPGEKNVIVDAKAPLGAYLEMLEAPDGEVKIQKLKAHARQVRAHIMALSSKSYWESLGSTPEFVVLFLPGETFFSAALEHDPSLIELGAEQKVILATPTTLIALLRAISYGWRQENISANAKLISNLGQELYKRLGDLIGHVNRMGRHLGGAVDAYNQATGSLERRVLVTARKFKEMGASSDTAELESAEQIDKQVRQLIE